MPHHPQVTTVAGSVILWFEAPIILRDSVCACRWHDTRGRLDVTNKLFAGLAAFASLGASSAYAAQPVDWQMTFQPAATEIMAQIRGFEVYTLWFIIPITLFVLGLLIYVMVKFRAGANPDAVQNQPQHRHRGGLDAWSGGHPSGNRHSLVQSAHSAILAAAG
jgi:hypothetical protein